MSSFTRIVLPVTLTAAVAALASISTGSADLIDQEQQAVTIVGSDQEQAMCSKRDHIKDMLAQDFRETPNAIGMVDQQAVVELFVSPQGTWTIVATDTEGNSCILSAGEGWQTAEPMTVGGEA